MAKGSSLFYFNTCRKDGVRDTMRNPENVLNSLREHSAQNNYSYDRLYRILYNQDFLLMAYQNIYANKGNMTAGVDGQTIDAMSLDRINRIISNLKDEKYSPNPARRTYIPKKNGKMRPLGIPSIDDKLVQEAMRMILEAIYDNSFEDTSHGFRPGKSCHTALRQIQNRFTRCKWFVEGDIKGFFDNIDHNVMIEILRKRIKDEKFLRLIRKFLNAGYMEDNAFHNTYSGAVQGGIISPILANIYLDQFDKYMKKYKEDFDKGKKRAILKSYTKMGDKRHRMVEKIKKEQNSEKKASLIRELEKHDAIYHSMPRSDAMDKSFRRIQYTRYADDFLIGVIGSKHDAELIKADIAMFLKNVLKLELSQEKTLVTIATDKARFLGFDIRARKQSGLQRKTKRGCYARNYGGHIVLEAPTEVIRKKLISLEAMKIKVVDGKEIWKAKSRRDLCYKQDIYILNQYNSEVRGICNYYSIANNRSKLHKFRYIMEYSMYKTFACKYRTTKADIIEKYRHEKDFAVKYIDSKGNEKLRTFWKGSLARNDFPQGAETDIVFSSKPVSFKNNPSLAKRLKANTCEWCGEHTTDVVMHQVRTLKDLDRTLPWNQHMIKINRKTLVVCSDCHKKIHLYEN